MRPSHVTPDLMLLRVPLLGPRLPLAPCPERADPDLTVEDVCAQIAAVKRLGTSIAASPDPNSELGLDDAATAPFQVSHRVNSALPVAVDHLEAFRALLQDLELAHPWAQHTLLRAALETAATALWLVSPEDPRVRRVRALGLMSRNARESGTAQVLGNRPAPAGPSADEVIQRIADMVPEGMTIRDGQWSGGAVMRAAAETLGATPAAFELLWRAQSGLAHGMPWASLAMLVREEVGDVEDDDVLNLNMSSSVDSLLVPAVIALKIIRATEALLERRSRPA